MEQAGRAMAEVWAKNLERQTEVVWLMNGSKPLLKIRRDGLLVDQAGTEIYIPFNQLQVKPLHGVGIQILNGEQKVITTNSGVPNFFVGLALISIVGNQQHTKAATNSN